MNVADKLRKCSDEELADFIYSIYLTGKSEHDLSNIITTYKSYKDVYEWLKEKIE